MSEAIKCALLIMIINFKILVYTLLILLKILIKKYKQLVII